MGLKARQPDAAGAERASERTGKIGRVFEDLCSPPQLEPSASTLTVMQWNVRSPTSSCTFYIHINSNGCAVYVVGYTAHAVSRQVLADGLAQFGEFEKVGACFRLLLLLLTVCVEADVLPAQLQHELKGVPCLAGRTSCAVVGGASAAAVAGAARGGRVCHMSAGVQPLRCVSA